MNEYKLSDEFDYKLIDENGVIISEGTTTGVPIELEVTHKVNINKIIENIKTDKSIKLISKNRKNIQIGDLCYSCYTHQWYICSWFHREHGDSYILSRLDGCGGYYESNTLAELQKKIDLDGGETEIFKCKKGYVQDSFITDIVLEEW